MTPKQTARLARWVRQKTMVGHRQVGVRHLGKDCPTRVLAPKPTLKDLSRCNCGVLLLHLGRLVYSYDVKQEVFARIGEQQGVVVWMQPSTVPLIPQAIRR